MTNVLNVTAIPRRQRCVNNEHPYIGGAVDVIDDDLQLTQAQINAIVLGGVDSRLSDIALTFVSVYNRINEVEREAGEDFSQIEERITNNENAINSETSRALRVEEELNLRITNLEQNPVVPENLAGHIFLTQEEYDALTTYEKDTLYIILEPKNSEGSSFGDAFPIILA